MDLKRYLSNTHHKKIHENENVTSVTSWHSWKENNPQKSKDSTVSWTLFPTMWQRLQHTVSAHSDLLIGIDLRCHLTRLVKIVKNICVCVCVCVCVFQNLSKLFPWFQGLETRKERKNKKQKHFSPELLGSIRRV